MDRTLAWVSRLVTARPWITLIVLIIVTFVMAAGGSLREPPPETAATLPKGSAVAEALVEIDDVFGESGDVRVVTLLFRGEALSPDGLAQMNGLVDDIVNEPDVAELLAPADPIIAPSMLVMALLQVADFESVTQAEIDNVSGPPAFLALLDAMTGTDADGTSVAVAAIRLRDTGDDRVADAERRIDEIAIADEGPLRVTSISYAVIEDEVQGGHRDGDDSPDRSVIAADRRPHPALHAHAVGPCAYASGPVDVDHVDHGSRGLDRARRTGSHRPSELADLDGADHRDRPYGRLCDPGGLPLPGATDRG